MEFMFICALILLLQAFALEAQPAIQWFHQYDKLHVDRCFEVIQIPDGGYALAGYHNFLEPPREDFYLVRTDENGDTLWTRYYGGNNPDECYDIIQTENGDFLLAGTTESYGQDGSGLIIRTDNEGNVIWTQVNHDAELFDDINHVSEDRFALIGVTHTGWDAYFSIIDEDGEELFSERYGGNGAEFGRDVVQTTDDGFLLAISSTSFGDGSWDYYLVKLDAEYEVEWTQVFGGEGLDACKSICKTLDGCYVIAGYSNSFNGNYDYYLVKIDENGEEIWSRTIGTRYPEVCRKVIQLENGDLVLAGNGDRDEAMGRCYVVRTDDQGEVIWEGVYWSQCECNSLIQTFDGGYAIAGKRNNDYFMIKLTTDIIAWLSLPDSSFMENTPLAYPTAYFLDYLIPDVYRDSALTFSVIDSGHISGEFTGDSLFITPQEDWYGLDSLILTVAEADSEANCDSTWLRLTVTENTSTPSLDESQIPAEFFLSDASPNPFNSTADIRFGLPSNSLVTLVIYDLTGQKIRELTNEPLQAGYHTSIWDGRNETGIPVSSGLYFYRINAGTFTQVKKMSMIK
jgi:hypothetical protein